MQLCELMYLDYVLGVSSLDSRPCLTPHTHTTIPSTNEWFLQKILETEMEYTQGIEILVKDIF